MKTMTDHSPITRLSARHSSVSEPPFTEAASQVVFLRNELSLILTLYGYFVAAGEWRDYGIATNKDAAIFSIFRRTSEMPVYRIVKTPQRAQKQGQWSILAMDGRILKRGQDLAMVLRLFDKKKLKPVN